jgi:hypothetical protein
MSVVATAMDGAIVSISFLLWGLLAGLGFVFMVVR